MLEELKKIEKNIPRCYRPNRYMLQQKVRKLRNLLKKGKKIENSVLDCLVLQEKSIQIRDYRFDQVPSVFYPKAMPILEKKDEIIQAIKENQVIVIAGETGSGKTTQLPKFCLEAGFGREGKIGCTQPRRVAATSIAHFLATELGEKNVAYKIRFDSTDSNEAFVKIMTDGILLMEIQKDRWLQEYDVLIIDEAHERSLNIDFILGYLKNLLPKRPDLKVIISSATIDPEAFSRFFNNAPVIEVSGRLFPVEVYYQPLDKELEEEGDVTIIDAAIDATKFLIEVGERGDILIFMPGEADIRETVDRLKGANWCNAMVLPFFGRLSAADQNYIFEPQEKRKIIVSTNIAETSLTIPGIHYVVDSGYARISRYCSKTRTKRLPIETISQSSADQRKGRCGRMEDGVCIRLYSEDDYLAREKFTSPEIKRSDLSEVILRMAAFHMGNMETFPFIEPPTQSAIQEGIKTLYELGALDENKELTPLGREMANLPIDPRTARILLSAIELDSLWEVLIIVSGITIQDPRERPLEKVTEAEEKHRRFMHKDSDFLTYVNLWNTYHATWNSFKTQNKVRKFCKENYLSYNRMREWCDLYEELYDVLDEQKKLKLSDTPPSYDAVHKAILSGFLGYIAHKKEKNLYYARQNREVMIYPGSALFNAQQDWIVAAEMLETSRLYAHVVARIDPSWIEPLAKSMLTYSYSNVHWNRQGGHVNATEKVSLWGLVIIEGRSVHYGRINRKIAREVFILEGLVRGAIDVGIPFLRDNLELQAWVQNMESKIRKHNLLSEEYVREDFYRECLPDVVNVSELQKYLLEHPDDRAFHMTKEHVLNQENVEIDSKLYPDFLYLGSQKLALTYVYDPGSELDGITVHIPEEYLLQLSSKALSWTIPAWLETKILALLKSLNKEARRKLSPVADRAHEIFEALEPNEEDLLDAMQNYILKKYSVHIKSSDWDLEEIPLYLKYRFVVETADGRILGKGRDLEKMQRNIRVQKVCADWQRALAKWYLPNMKTWCCGTIPEFIEVTPYQGGMQHNAYVGLEYQKNQVNRTLFHFLALAEQNSSIAISVLLQYSLTQELSKLEKAIYFSQDIIDDFKNYGWSKDLVAESTICLRKAILPPREKFIRTEQEFKIRRNQIQEQISWWVSQWTDILDEILDEYDELQYQLKLPKYIPKTKLLQDIVEQIRYSIRTLFPKQFLTSTAAEQLKHYPRYLKALQLRLSRAFLDPLKDQKKWQELVPHMQNLAEAAPVVLRTQYAYKLMEYRWMIEEYKVSLFAQELKTPYSVSLKKLSEKWSEIESL